MRITNVRVDLLPTVSCNNLKYRYITINANVNTATRMIKSKQLTWLKLNIGVFEGEWPAMKTQGLDITNIVFHAPNAVAVENL